jgi:ABC-type nickel/cobalt efflux system permease component RcnA
MTPLLAVTYSFLFGLLHGILPDEHTWPITFSYAIGGASGKEGLKAGLFFSAAFTVQRALLSEVAYLALAPFLLSPTINGIVYIVVGLAMSAAGAIVVRRNRVPHLHLVGHHHDEDHKMEAAGQLQTAGHLLSRTHHAVPSAVGYSAASEEPVAQLPVKWTLIHGFIAGFGFGGFSLFVNTVAAPAMDSPWFGFLPGLVFGLGTMIVLVLVGALFGASLRWTHALTEQEVKRIGSQTGGRTLFFGGGLFAIAGIATLLGLTSHLPVDAGYVLIGLFMIAVAVPAFVYSLKEVLAARKSSGGDAAEYSAAEYSRVKKPISASEGRNR